MTKKTLDYTKTETLDNKKCVHNWGLIKVEKKKMNINKQKPETRRTVRVETYKCRVCGEDMILGYRHFNRKKNVYIEI